MPLREQIDKLGQDFFAIMTIESERKLRVEDSGEWLVDGGQGSWA